MKQWQATTFNSLEAVINWMNCWDVIHVDHIVPTGAGFAVLYRHKTNISADQQPSARDREEALWT